MKINIFFLLVVTLIAASCKKNDLESKKEELTAYKKELNELRTKISDLQQEIAKLDTAVDDPGENAVLVNAKRAEPKDFSHKIEVRGQVASRKNIMISAEIGGKIQSIAVTEGQSVKKGQQLMLLEADVIRNNIAELKTSLELANAVYQRQTNLWKQNIGTEIQYLEAKNKKESLERRLATAYSQLARAVIKAPFDGTVDAIPVREGELAQPGLPLIRLVNPESMYIEAAVSERYIGDLEKDDPVELYFPGQDHRITSIVSSVSNVINPDNRTFSIEVQLPEVDFLLKPNQVVILQIEDYKAENAIVVPTEIILTDKDGKYVYTASKEGNATVARKKRIQIGMTQNGETEVLSGLKKGELFITAGHRSLSEGALIKHVERTTDTAQLQEVNFKKYA